MLMVVVATIVTLAATIIMTAVVKMKTVNENKYVF